MAEWMFKQIILPLEDEEQIFSEKPDTADYWSSNLITLCQGGVVKQFGIHGLPGTKIYAGPLLSNITESLDRSLIIGPTGILQFTLGNENFYISDIRISKASYDLLKSNNSYVSIDIVTSFAPSQGTSRRIIYNGGGVTNE